KTHKITEYNDINIKETNNNHVHITIKDNPKKNPKNFIETCFYYMDSLIEPVCKKNDFQFFENNKVSLSQDYQKKEILQIAKDTFIHGRFHRDFNVPNSLADIRYMRWVEDLMEEKNL